MIDEPRVPFKGEPDFSEKAVRHKKGIKAAAKEKYEVFSRNRHSRRQFR